MSNLETSTSARLPVTVLSGFLGAGKTTLALGIIEGVICKFAEALSTQQPGSTPPVFFIFDAHQVSSCR